jgi:hypothetical protein
MSRDVIDVKRAYIRVAGDMAAGVLLSQCVYWFLPARDGSSKLTIERDGKWWLAKGGRTGGRNAAYVGSSSIGVS